MNTEDFNWLAIVAVFAAVYMGCLIAVLRYLDNRAKRNRRTHRLARWLYFHGGIK